MARSLNGSTDSMANTGGAVLSAVPITMACWFWANTGSMSSSNSLMSLKASGSSHHFRMFVDNRIYARTYGGSDADASSTNGAAPAVNTWHHGCVVYSAVDARAAYLNGGDKGTNTTSQTPSSINRTYVGNYDGLSGVWNGYIAEAAIWNAALDDAEVLSLARGMSPLLIRPGLLAAYWPLIGRDSPEPDRRGGFPLTLSGTAVVEHPRIILPTSYRMTISPPASGSTQTGAGASDGVATVSGVGASTAASAAASVGVATPTAVGASTAEAVGGSSAGVAAASGTGAATADSLAASAGAATAAATAESTAASVAASAGVGAATATSEATAASVAASNGVAAGAGVGASTATTIAASAGVAAAASVGAATAEAIAAAAGVATVEGVGQGLSTSGAGASVAGATATGVGAALVEALASSAGVALALGISPVSGGFSIIRPSGSFIGRGVSIIQSAGVGRG